MGVGKYSPTVSAAYGADQEWHRKLRPEDDWYDDEGYDSYGYHKESEKDPAVIGRIAGEVVSGFNEKVK
jgi:hypothetical protein